MVTVSYIEFDGEEHVVEVAPGSSVMQGAVHNGVRGIIAECGGNLQCATCHVYVDPAWVERLGEQDELEEMTLDGVAHILRDNSRLGCQVLLDEDMDGLRVTVAPPQ